MSDAVRFVSSEELKAVDSPWGINEWLCGDGVCEADKLALVRVSIPPGKGHDFHRHPESEEIIYVVEGEAEQWVGKEKRMLSPGEVAHIPTNEVHCTHNVSDKMLTVLAILSPAATVGPMTVDVFDEEPWNGLRS